MEYIAHIRSEDGEIQSVTEHLREVQAACERRGEKIGVGSLAGLAGRLHDMGKYTDAFQSYIREAAAHPEAPPRRGSVDHSTAGGRLIYKRYGGGEVSGCDKVAAEWLANCVMSHHQGLRDFLDPQLTSPFLERAEQKDLKEYGQAEALFLEDTTETELDQYFVKVRDEIHRHIIAIQSQRLPAITVSLLIKYIFSCLIDADRTDTRRFEEKETGPEQALDHIAFFNESYLKLMERIESFDQAEDADHPVNVLRRQMSRQCEAHADQPPGIYTLSIPTGGGKTLASLRYALQHARKNNLERIIYVVPYTTIIEQNAKEIREIVQQDDMILEHHSNVVEEREPEEDSDEYDARKRKLQLARDNWDRPIIFTTMVQFLNTFYAKGTRNARRMHQLSRAVLIFDEVQSVPVKCISLFNAALNFLHTVGRSSLVLCTATQPALDYVKHGLHLPEQAEIIPQLEEVGRSFKRVELIDRIAPEGWGAAELAGFVQEQLQSVNSVLVILNTKSAVRKLFDQLAAYAAGGGMKDQPVNLFHLSTNMCAAHRKQVLEKLLKALEKRERVVCVSTQLIEAGVNISFECVVRSLAGLDSIAQAAGRCNRHGKDQVRNVFIIRSADEVLTHLPEIRIGGQETARVLSEFARNPGLYGHDLLSAEAMRLYFKYYYDKIKLELDYPVRQLGGRHLFDLLSTNSYYRKAYEGKFGKRPRTVTPTAFATEEEHFQVIDNCARSVLVPYEEGNEIIAALNGELGIGELGELLRKSQQYVVNIYEHEWRKLEKNGDLYPLLNGQAVALRETAYSEEFGLEVEGDGEMSFAIH